MILFLIGLTLAVAAVGSAGAYAKQVLINDAKSQTGGYF